MFLAFRAPSARGSEEAAAEAARGSALAAHACAAEGCGCPHQVVPASCCCEGRSGAGQERSEVRSRAGPSVVAVDAARESGLPAPTVESFHCSGGKRGHASAEMRVTPAATHTAASIENAPER